MAEANADVKELLHLKGIKSDNSFEKSEQLTELAIRLGRHGKTEECFEALELAREEVLKAGIDEEKPKKLCEIAACFSRNGRPLRSKELIDESLEVLEAIRTESPWKYTNYLAYIAYVISQSEGGNSTAKGILDRALSSLPGINDYYGRRKQEILSFLRGFAEDEGIKKGLVFDSGEEKFKNVEVQAPTRKSVDHMQSEACLSPEKIKMIKQFVKNNANQKDMGELVSSIDERWRQAVSWVVLSMRLLEKGDAQEALSVLDKALTTTKRVRFYWVRDKALIIIIGAYLNIYEETSILQAKTRVQQIPELIKDHWKRARGLCTIAAALIDDNKSKEAAEILNHVYSHLLGRINYSHRTAMSMLLLSNIYGGLSENSPIGRIRKRLPALGILDKNKRRAETLRMEAERILESYPSSERQEALDEYDEFVSLRAFMRD